MQGNIRTSLKVKLFLLFFTLDLFVILMLGLISYQSKKEALKQQAENSLSISSAELADKVDRYLADKYEDISAIALHYSLQGLKTTTSSQNRILSEYLKIYPYYEHISIINVEDVKKPEKGGNDYGNSWYLPAMKGFVTSSDMYISPLTDKPTMSFAAPIRDSNGKLVSIITANLNLEYVWEMLDAVAKENKASGHSGYAVLINSKGLLLAHPKRDKILHQDTAAASSEMRNMIKDMTSGKSGTAYYSYEGVRKISGYAPLKGFGDYRGHGWSLGVAENYSELIEPMNRLLKVYFMLFVLMSIVAFVLSKYLAEYLMKPVNELKDGAARIGTGNFGMRIPENRADEIGKLANSFNKMAETLEERDRQINKYTESLKEANRELENKRSELTRTNIDLQSTNEELVRLEKEKADFNAMITHDIKSPLSTILTYAEMIRDGSISKKDEIGIAMSSVYSSGKRILTLVDNYLVSSAIDAGKFKLNLQSLNVNELIEESLALFVPQAERRSVTITFIKDDTVPQIMADKVQLDRVVVNILSNALKYIPSGSSVTVYTRPADDGVEIAISDTGRGIPEKDAENMFQKFRRSSETGKIDGLGLGLYISKAITEAHGGSISLKSRVGAGTTFTIHLPANNESSGSLHS